MRPPAAAYRGLAAGPVHIASRTVRGQPYGREFTARDECRAFARTETPVIRLKTVQNFTDSRLTGLGTAFRATATPHRVETVKQLRV